MRPTLPGKSSPKSHRSQPFPGNSGQGQNYQLQTRQSACPGRIQRATLNCGKYSLHCLEEEEKTPSESPAMCNFSFYSLRPYPIM